MVKYLLPKVKRSCSLLYVKPTQEGSDQSEDMSLSVDYKHHLMTALVL